MAKHFAGPAQGGGGSRFRSADAGQGADERNDNSQMWGAPQGEPGQDPARTGGHFAEEPKRRSDVLSNVLIVVGIALLVAAGLIFFHNQKNYEKIDVENEKVAEYARLSDDGQEPPTVDWESLRAMNPDIVGWLQVPGTIINYPVYQSYDNEYYLEHAPDRSDSIGGSVFLDFESIAPGMVDAQTIIYGHHMRNGSQFKPIADMDSQELFDGVNRVWYVTEKGAYDLAPLFLFYTTETDTYVRQFAFDSPEAFHDYLNTYYANAVTKRADADAIIAGASRVLTLSTCNYYDGYGRTLLVCVPRYEIPGTAEYEQYHAQAAAVAAAQAAAEAEAAAAAAAEPAPEG